MIKRQYAGLAFWMLGVPGCVENPALQQEATRVADSAIRRPVSAQGVMVVLPTVASGGYGLQALLTPWTRNDVHHLVLRLSILQGADEQPVMVNGVQVKREVQAQELSEPVAFRGLRPMSLYRVRAFAYRSAGETTQDLISVDDYRSWADVYLGQDDRPTVTVLPVKLRDVPFSGEATAGIVIEDGTYSTGQETLS
ncbi:MAG: hypothetical protein VKO21_03035 [Candidatus Sericytochromatia bacterium]|nr:hypothetical protein [Candidatus Sericytochromatia bacterium]